MDLCKKRRNIREQSVTGIGSSDGSGRARTWTIRAEGMLDNFKRFSVHGIW